MLYIFRENICTVQKLENGNGGNLSDDGDVLNTSAEGNYSLCICVVLLYIIDIIEFTQQLVVEEVLEGTPGFELPAATLVNLPRILETIIQNSNTPQKRERLAMAVLKDVCMCGGSILFFVLFLQYSHCPFLSSFCSLSILILFIPIELPSKVNRIVSYMRRLRSNRKLTYYV